MCVCRSSLLVGSSGGQTAGWMAHSFGPELCKRCQCQHGTLAGAGGTKVCVQPSAQAHPSQLFAHMEHPRSTPGLARGHREAAEKAEYLLSTQNKLVHEDAAVAHAAHIVQRGQAQAVGADQAHCDSHWG